MISIDSVKNNAWRLIVNKELSFDDDIYSADDEDYEDDALMDSKIPVGRFAKIIDEFEAAKDDSDDEVQSDIDLDWLGFH
jgi:hypothetical protein